MELTIVHIVDSQNVCREFYVEGPLNKDDALQAIQGKYTCPSSYFAGSVTVYNKSSGLTVKL